MSYNLIMSDILIVVTELEPKVPRQPPLRIHMESMLKDNDISYERIDDCTWLCLISFGLLRPVALIDPFYHYQLAIRIQFSGTVLAVKTVIYDDRSLPVKAGSTGQKLLLIKYAVSLNHSNQDFQLKVHPITGQIELHSVYNVGNSGQIVRGVYYILNSFRTNWGIIYKIMEVLEQIPVHSKQNTFCGKLMEKMGSLSTLIAGANIPDMKLQSQEQNFHKKFYLVEESSRSNKNLSSSMNLVQKMRKTYVEQPLSLLVHNNTKVKLYNFMYLALDPTPNLLNLLKTIDTNNFLGENEQITDKFSCNGRQISLQYRYQRPQSINYQYSVADKISKKQNYFTFLKQYIVVRNHLKITSNYLMVRAGTGEAQTLLQFYEKNKNTLSMETKMRLAGKLLAIGCVCLERTENFGPGLWLANILVDQNMNFKLDSIKKSEVNPRVVILQSIFWLLMRKKYFRLNQNGIKVNYFTSFENETIKFMGPSVVMKILLKSLQNYQKDLISNQSTENLLLILNRLTQTLQNVINGRQQAVQF